MVEATTSALSSPAVSTLSSLFVQKAPLAQSAIDPSKHRPLITVTVLVSCGGLRDDHFSMQTGSLVRMFVV